MDIQEWGNSVRNHEVARWFDRLGKTRAEKDAALRDNLEDWYRQAVTLHTELQSYSLPIEPEPRVIEAVMHLFLCVGVELLGESALEQRLDRNRRIYSKIDSAVRLTVIRVWPHIITAIDERTFRP